MPHHELYAVDIVNAALWLTRHDLLGRSQALEILGNLWNSPRVDIASKLFIEEFLYDADAL